MYEYGYISDQIKAFSIKHSHWSQRQTLHYWSGLVRCWGQTHGTNVHLWGRQVRNTWQHWKSVRSHFGVKWRLFELLNQDGQQLKHWHTQHVHDSVQTLPKCKHWVNHPTHAKCSHYNACPDHILNCFDDGVDHSITKIQQWLHSQVNDYTMESRLPCSCWSNSWQNWTPYVIYTLYINIFI